MKWIIVKDIKPPSGIKNKSLFVNGKKEVTFGYTYPLEEGWNTGNEASVWINDFDRQTNEIATHWMPLPEPPKEYIEMPKGCHE